MNTMTNCLSDMLMFKIICDGNRDNDYTFFLYLASIMNFAENNNGGCLTKEGIKSLRVNVLPYSKKLMSESKLTQKELLSFLLNTLNSYYVSLLAIKLFTFYNENRTQFLQLYNFPSDVLEDFEYLKEKIEKQTIVKPFLDLYTKSIDGKYIKMFNEEKTKGFHKHIFDTNSFASFDI